MSDVRFACPHCQQHLSADTSMAGTEVTCPACSGRLIVPELPPSLPRPSSSSLSESKVCPYCRAEITFSDIARVCPACHTPHHEDCWKENRGCTVFGCSMAPPDEEKTSLVGAPTAARMAGTAPALSSAAPSPIFLYIPLSRLVVMSILSLGLYEAYWIYRNWRYLKERDGLDIRPFWRGFYGIFYCYSTLKAIRTDQQANAIMPASFSAGSLAIGWFIAMLFNRFVPILPSFLFILPVQEYINRINDRISPRPPYKSWSVGHIVCLAHGAFLWLMIIANLVASWD